MGKKARKPGPRHPDLEQIRPAIESAMAAIKRHGWKKFLEQVKQAPKPPLHGEWFEVAESLNRERSDRALAIVAAAFLDDVLGELIARRLANGDSSALKQAIPEQGALARRISLAASIGLVGPKEASDLRTIKDIRNRFAHRALGLTFDEPDIAAKCKAFAVLKKATADGKPFDFSTWPPRDQFRMAAFALTSHLQMLIPTVERLPTKKDGEWPFGNPLEHVARWTSQSTAPPSGP